MQMNHANPLLTPAGGRAAGTRRSSVHCGHPSGGSQGCRYSAVLAIGLAAVVSAAAGCGSDTKPAALHDEVVARVNGEVITIHQLDQRLAQIGIPAEGDSGAARKRLLDILIDEQLLLQKAIARGLDKNPATRNAIERARRQLLVQAAIDDAGGEPDMSERESRAFYLANPNLFGKRRVYTFHRFLLESGKLEGTVRAKLDSAKTDADVMAVLKDSGITYGHVTELRTAESLPAELLAQAARMAPGDIILFAEGSRTILMQLAGSIGEPLSIEAAMPLIQGYLADARRQMKTERLVKDLRGKAKIEYAMQTAESAQSTALAEAKPVFDEPNPKKPFQSRQTTAVR